MIIEFAKQKDGSAVLRCTRDDGSVSWQKQEGKYAAFFPLHDLMHYAVETELEFRRGFYGLIAEGWDIAETTGKTPRGALPNETLEVEYLVSAFSAERASGDTATAAEFNQLATTFAQAKGMPEAHQLSDQELRSVRSRFDELATRWRALPADAAIQLTFPATPPARSSS
ncbi:MAG TPA: hypothetical protein VH188_05760 [Chthoniobacterales bacterium]|nr:hypothetical protein [Chthoniobacterales bacterium]